MVRYAVGYRSRAFVTFGAPIAARRLRPALAARRAGPRAPHARRDRARCYKVLPTALVAAAHAAVDHAARARGARRRAHRRRSRAAGANLGVTDAPRGGRRGRRAARGRAASSSSSAAASACASATCCATTRGRSSTCCTTPAEPRPTDDRRAVEGRSSTRSPAAATLQDARVALRHAQPRQLRAALHRRRDRRRGDRRRAGGRSRRALRSRSTTSARAWRAAEEADAATARVPARSSTRSSPSGIERNISLKLTQLGLDVDRATAASTTCAASSSRPRATGSSCASTWRTRRTPR